MVVAVLPLWWWWFVVVTGRPNEFEPNDNVCKLDNFDNADTLPGDSLLLSKFNDLSCFKLAIAGFNVCKWLFERSNVRILTILVYYIINSVW